MTLPSTPHSSTQHSRTPHASTPHAGTSPVTYPGLAPRLDADLGPGHAAGSGAAGELDLPSYLQDNPQRDAVVRRLALAGVRHARAVEERRGRGDEPGPHAIVFFYAPPRPGPGGQVTVASRAFLHGDDVSDLASVLRTIGARAREYRTLDPRRHLANTVEDMHPASTYLGVGTSTLLPPVPGGAITYPWHGLACLTDGTHLTISADAYPLAVGGPNAMRVTTNRTLGRGIGLLIASPYSWTWATTHGHRGSPLAHLLPTLTQLHDHLAATQARAQPAHR